MVIHTTRSGERTITVRSVDVTQLEIAAPTLERLTKDKETAETCHERDRSQPVRRRAIGFAPRRLRSRTSC